MAAAVSPLARWLLVGLAFLLGLHVSTALWPSVALHVAPAAPTLAGRLGAGPWGAAQRAFPPSWSGYRAHFRDPRPRPLRPEVPVPYLTAPIAPASSGQLLRSAPSSRGSSVTRGAWLLFFPALLVAVMSKVYVFFFTVSRKFRGFIGGLAATKVMQADSAEAERKLNLEACKRVALLGVGANLLLFLMQAILGVVGNSAGLIAKAVDSFGDLMGDAVSFISIKKAHQPPDDSHQFGHGKFESLGALSIATLLMIAAWEAATESFEALQETWKENTFAGPSMYALYGAALSIVIKEALYRVMMAVGKETKSDSTIANANHHRMDGFASGVVFVGIIGGRLGLKSADPLAGILVAFIIVKAAYDIAMEAFNDLTDGIPNFGDIDIHQILTEAIAGSAGVFKYDNLRARKMGPFIGLQLDLHVDPALTVHEVAALEHRVKQHVLEANEAITEIGFRLLPAAGPTPVAAVPAMA